MGEFLLHSDSDLHHLLSLEEFEPIFFLLMKGFEFPHVRNKVTTFKYLSKLEVLDGIINLST